MRRLVPLAACLALACSALAQNRATSRGDAGGGPPEPRTSGPVLTLRFPGGTVAEYLAALRAASPSTPINVAAAPDALVLKVPETSLANVTLETALQAIAATSFQQGHRRLFVENLGGAFSSDSAYALIATPARTASAVSDFQVLSLRDLTESGGMKVETVLTAIESALGLVDPDAPAPVTKFHKDSGLLMLRGTPPQLSAVEQTIRRLEASTKAADVRTRTTLVAQAEAKARLDRSLAMVEVSRRRVEIAQAARDEAVKLGEKGHVSANEVRGAEYALAEAVAQLRSAEAEFAAARVAAENGVPPSMQDTDALAQENKRLRDELAALRQLIEQLKSTVDNKSKGAPGPSGGPPR